MSSINVIHFFSGLIFSKQYIMRDIQVEIPLFDSDLIFNKDLQIEY